MNKEEKYMRRCIQLALKGKGHVSPNPMVGAVIVYGGKIIGEGYHRQYGENHAEVNAILSVKDQSLLPEATLYVNLEPCSHYGKTPPCSELIIRHNIKEVIIGHTDPCPHVSGRGIKMLKAAGIRVKAGVLEPECRELNKRFLTYYEENRPYIFLKWAQSADGFIDKKRASLNGEQPFCFSNDYSLLRVHKLRAEEDAIMVGYNTVLLDNPSLTTRYWDGKNPLRITIDRNCTLSRKNRIFDEQAETIVFSGKDTGNPGYHLSDDIKGTLKQIIMYLYDQKIQSLIVEGGSRLLNTFLKLGLWDEIRIETAPDVLLKDGVPAPVPEGILQSVENCKNSLLFYYRNKFIH